MRTYQNRFNNVETKSTIEIIKLSKGRLGSTDRRKFLATAQVASIWGLTDTEFQAALPYLAIDILQTHWYCDLHGPKGDNIERALRLVHGIRNADRSLDKATVFNAAWEARDKAPKVDVPVSEFNDAVTSALATLVKAGLVSVDPATGKVKMG